MKTTPQESNFALKWAFRSHQPLQSQIFKDTSFLKPKKMNDLTIEKM